MNLVSHRAIEGAGTLESAWLGWRGLAQITPITVSQLVPRSARAVVVAPHPDDEVLVAGGLLTQLTRIGLPIVIIAVTDGTASHCGSSLWPAERLAQVRPRESVEALHRLGVVDEPVRLGLPDGGLAFMRELLERRLRALLCRNDVVFTTWRKDGHPDHEATGHACACAAASVGARLVEVPVWAWHWAAPGDSRLPWRGARRIALDQETVLRKQEALQAFTSQLLPDKSTGAGPILSAGIVQRAARRFEVVFP